MGIRERRKSGCWLGSSVVLLLVIVSLAVLQYWEVDEFQLPAALDADITRPPPGSRSKSLKDAMKLLDFWGFPNFPEVPSSGQHREQYSSAWCNGWSVRFCQYHNVCFNMTAGNQTDFVFYMPTEDLRVPNMTVFWTPYHYNKELSNLKFEPRVVRGTIPASVKWLPVPLLMHHNIWSHNIGHLLMQSVYPFFMAASLWESSSENISDVQMLSPFSVDQGVALDFETRLHRPGNGPWAQAIALGTKNVMAAIWPLLSDKPLRSFANFTASIRSGDLYPELKVQNEQILCVKKVMAGHSALELFDQDNDHRALQLRLYQRFLKHLLETTDAAPSAHHVVFMVKDKGRGSLHNLPQLIANFSEYFPDVRVTSVTPNKGKFKGDFRVEARLLATATVMFTQTGGIGFTAVMLPPGAQLLVYENVATEWTLQEGHLWADIPDIQYFDVAPPLKTDTEGKKEVRPMNAVDELMVDVPRMLRVLEEAMRRSSGWPLFLPAPKPAKPLPISETGSNDG